MSDRNTFYIACPWCAEEHELTVSRPIRANEVTALQRSMNQHCEARHPEQDLGRVQILMGRRDPDARDTPADEVEEFLRRFDQSATR